MNVFLVLRECAARSNMVSKGLKGRKFDAGLPAGGFLISISYDEVYAGIKG